MNGTAPADTTGEDDNVYHGRAGSKLLAKLCIAFVIFHLVMTALYLGPTPGPLRSIANRYMEPVFKQSWWVFAPDPVSSNKYLMVRGKKRDGTMTPWFDITRCDVDSAILHHPVPDRRYLTTFQLMRHLEIGRDNLPTKAQPALHSDVNGSDWGESLSAKLQDAGATRKQAGQFVKNDRAVANLASRIAETRWGSDVTQVQVQMKIVHTRPFAQRNTNVPLETEVWQQGFVPVSHASAQENAEIAKLYGPQGGC